MNKRPQNNSQIGPKKHLNFAGISLALALVLSLIFTSTLSSQNPQPLLKALIVTGQNPSHDWRVSTAALKQILEDTGLFQVEVAESPAQGAKMDGFEPRFAAYRVVVLNYSGDSWPPATRKAFAAYVKNGGGVVVYHAANNAFPGWPEYNEIIGLGGWSNRNESFGPYVFWKDGQIVQDTEPGVGGYHTPPHPFLIVARATDHPVTAGLPQKWMHAPDELYGLLRGPAKNLTVLATAHSAFEESGSGRDEPVLFTVNYGAGRVFHTVLGHAGGERPPALECAGFIVTFQRGAEWAATGKVTQKVPADFPETYRDISTPEDVRLWPGCRPPSLEAILKDLSAFEYSRDEAVLYRLRDYVLRHRSPEEARVACEDRLINYLETTEHPYARLAVCRALRLVGSDKSVPTLGKMLWREDTTDMARYALEKIPGKAADTALLAALEQTQNETKIGIISSLGQRKSVQAVKALAVLVNDADSALAAAATTAMGRIGGVEAAAALAEAYDRAAGEAKTNLAYALLSSADGYWAARNFPAALALYEKILSAHPQQLPLVVRRTAFKGRILCLEKPDASKLVVETLTKGPEDMHEPAIGEVAMLFRPADIGPVVEALPKLPEASGVQLLSILTQYPRENVLQAVIEATKSPALAVRVAALEALAIVGDSSSVLFLAERSAASAGREQLAARASLWKLVGKDIDEKVMFHLVSTPNEAVRNELIQAIRERRITQGKAHLLTVARGGSSRNIQEAARALRSIASPIDIPVLLQILLETGDETVQAEMQTTIGVVAKKIPDEYARANAVEKMLTLDTSSKEQPITDVTKRCLLYRTLGRIGDDSSLALLRTALQDQTVEIQDAAVRALADWPNGTPREECLAIARTSANFTHRVLALRAFVRMVGLQKYQSPQTAIQSLKTALDLATRPEEKKLVLGALEAFPSPEALALAESLLTAEGVQAEAQAAVDKIKETLEKK